MGTVRPSTGIEPEVYSTDDALALLKMFRAFFYAEMNRGRIRTFLRGQLRMTTRAAIREYLQLVEAESLNPDGTLRKNLGVIGKGRGRS
jgi:hypothetical protein